MNMASDLNALLDKLDLDSRNTVFTLLNEIDCLVARHGDLPVSRGKWHRHHYLIYLLHCVMMSILDQETKTLAFAAAYSRGDWGMEAQNRERGQ
jgi:hypothetical protein